jgi:transcriptional regulator with XRE-family HTH domain
VLQKKLGQRIASLRKIRRLTQAQLAKAVGCSVEFVSLVERGVNAPSVAGLEEFAKALKVEVVDLFTFPGRERKRINKRRITKRVA